MSVRGGHRIDWRQQHNALADHFAGAGGVIHVHAAQGAPVRAFCRVLTEDWLRDPLPHQWSYLLIESEDASTYDIGDLVEVIASQAGISLPQETPASNVTINVGTNNKAKHVELSNNSISYSPTAPASWRNERERVKHLCAELQKHLETKRLALIFVDSHKFDRQRLTRLARDFWANRLELLVPQGLLVIHIYDPEALSQDKFHGWPPDPHGVMNLPRQFEGEARAVAREDIAGIALQEGLFQSPTEALAWADGVLSFATSVAEVHSRLAVATAQMGRVNVRTS